MGKPKSMGVLVVLLTLIATLTPACKGEEIVGRVTASQTILFKNQWSLTCEIVMRLEGVAASAYRKAVLRGEKLVEELKRVLEGIIRDSYREKPANILVDGRKRVNLTLNRAWVNMTGLRGGKTVTIRILMELEGEERVKGRFFVFNEGERLFYHMKGFEYNFLNKTVVLPANCRVWRASPKPSIALLTPSGKTVLEWEILSPEDNVPIQVCFFNEKEYPDVKKLLDELEAKLRSLSYASYLGLDKERRELLVECEEAERVYYMESADAADIMAKELLKKTKALEGEARKRLLIVTAMPVVPAALAAILGRRRRE